MGHNSLVVGVAFNPITHTLASASWDKTVNLWDVASGKLVRTLEGHTSRVDAIAFSSDGRLLASKSHDGTLRLWSCDTWQTLGIIPELPTGSWNPSLAFHPTLPLLATHGSMPGAQKDERFWDIHLWELDLNLLLGQTQKVRPATRVAASARGIQRALLHARAAILGAQRTQ